MSAAFTPGPWDQRPILIDEDTAFRKRGEPTGEYDVFYSDGKEGLNEDPWFVAIVCGGAPGSTEANARLIAAAPELYEALGEIAKGEGPFNREPLIHAENTIESMKEIANAALAKARGQ